MENVIFKQVLDGYTANRQYLNMIWDSPNRPKDAQEVVAFASKPVAQDSKRSHQRKILVIENKESKSDVSSDSSTESCSSLPVGRNNSAMTSCCRAPVQNCCDGYLTECAGVRPTTNVCFFSSPYAQPVACNQPANPVIPTSPICPTNAMVHEPELNGSTCHTASVLQSPCLHNTPFQSGAISEQSNSTVIFHGLGTILNKFRSKRAIPTGDPAYKRNSIDVLKYLHNSFLDQQGCDAILRTKDGDITTHQVVLGTYSPTVDGYLKGNKKTLQQTIMIKVQDCSLEAVADVLNFLYTTDITLNCLNIGFITDVANQLDIPILLRLCNDYLVQTVEVDNAFLHLSVAFNNNFVAAVEILKFIATNFFDLVDHEHMMILPFDKFVTIVTHPALCAKELEIFRAIVNWVSCNRQGRLQYAKDLLGLVRFHMIDPEELASHVELQDWIFSDSGCKNIILEAYK